MNEYEAGAYISRALSSLHHAEATPDKARRFVAPVLADPATRSMLQFHAEQAIRRQQEVVANANRRITDIQEFLKLCREPDANPNVESIHHHHNTKQP